MKRKWAINGDALHRKPVVRHGAFHRFSSIPGLIIHHGEGEGGVSHALRKRVTDIQDEHGRIAVARDFVVTSEQSEQCKVE